MVQSYDSWTYGTQTFQPGPRNSGKGLRTYSAKTAMAMRGDKAGKQ